MSSSPPSIPPRGDFYFKATRDKADSDDEKISVLDPRRFTPTLHASLVSEILSLRRELDGKNNLVLGLEESLHDATVESAKLNNVIATNAQDSRSVKRQMELLEAGTLSAVEDMAKERDQARESLSETRRRLELLQKRARSQEEEAERTRTLWEGDKQQWATEKMILDRKVHIVEGRLKTILAEVGATQLLDQHQTFPDGDTEVQENKDVSGRRSQSSASHRSIDTPNENEARAHRFSHVAGNKGHSFVGATLAEELKFGAGDVADLDDSDIDAGYVSPEALPEEAFHRPRPFSAQSYRQSLKARKVLGLTVGEDDSVIEETSQDSTQVVGREQDATNVMISEPVATRYISAATQCSHPTSPALKPLLESTGPAVCLKAHGLEVSSKQENITHQDTSPPSQPLLREINLPRIISMISQACQTSHQPLSPPETPVALEVAESGSGRLPGPVEMKIASTQTEEDRVPVEAKDIPVIAIHPPITDPSSIRNSVVLPPRTKNAACQVYLPTPSRSVSVQTEEIRVDKRPFKLPLNLLPSSIASTPPSPNLPSPAPPSRGPLLLAPEAKVSAYNGKTQRKALTTTRDPIAKDALIPGEDRVATPSEDAYPGNNDNGMLSTAVNTGPRRPIRAGSLFAGFGNSNDNNLRDGRQSHNDADYSDDSFEDKEPIRKTLSKVQNSWKLIPQTKDSVGDRLESNKQDVSAVSIFDDQRGHSGLPIPLPESTSTSTSNSSEAPQKRRADSAPKHTVSNKQSDMRRAALISSGTLAHVQQPHNPSAADRVNTISSRPAPPFPVPTRASSRKIPVSVSEGATSPTPESTSFFSGQIGKTSVGPPVKRPVLRKIRSAAATAKSSRNEFQRKRSHSPPPPTPDLYIPQSPQRPPHLPQDDVTTPFRETFEQPRQRPQSSAGTDAELQQTGVVDAIAQTMIGEWMWKYVRKRKSFGMGDSPAADVESGLGGNDSGTRHKRWVWLAPYERAIMWSSKQPTSGPALMGKSGRKLTIECAYDVTDDTPMPKNVDPVSSFGRSIVVVTPQRSLKLTATTKERHYVWLAALSFLSHSSLGKDDFSTTLPPVPPKEYHRPADQRSTAVLRRAPIRDSIRLAKGESRPDIKGRRAYTSPTYGLHGKVINEYTGHFEPQKTEESAEPPFVPRSAADTRHRSNTATKATPSGSYRAFPTINRPSNRSPAPASSGNHGQSSVGAERQAHDGPYNSLLKRTRGNSSSYNSEIEANSFLDAMGTVRMEAFVDRTRTTENVRTAEQRAHQDRTQEKAYQKPPGEEKKRQRGSYRTRQGRKKDMSYWGGQSEFSRIEAVLNNPFEGF
ncbi:hypothetical protein MMC13_006536 [Lambiella insularis]|nr:hypothetical protein [Lambiella insularis]